MIAVFAVTQQIVMRIFTTLGPKTHQNKKINEDTKYFEFYSLEQLSTYKTLEDSLNEALREVRR